MIINKKMFLKNCHACDHKRIFIKLQYPERNKKYVFYNSF